MENITVQVCYAHGCTVTAQKDSETGTIYVQVIEGQTGRVETAFLDPKDAETKVWLKRTFPPLQFDILVDDLEVGHEKI